MILAVPIYGQRDNRWALQRLGTTNGITIGSHGCVTTSMSMLSSYYGHQIFPNQLDDFLTNNNLYYDGDLFVNASITKLFSDIKFDKVVFCETSPAPISDIKSYLDLGKPVVVSLINFGVRHFILAVGYDGDRIYANDPWQGDQVAINDRWGDPKLKILQVNFFSGLIPSTKVPVQDPIVTQPVVSHPSDGPHMDDGVVVSLPTPVIPTPAPNPVTVSMPPVDVSPIKDALDDGLSNIKDTLIQATLANQSPVDQVAPQSFLDKLKSRKFILAGISGLVTLINSIFHIGITNDQLMIFLIPVLAYIIGESIADIIERARK